MIAEIKKGLHVAVIEWLKWIRNPRMIIAGILPITVKIVAIDPLIRRSAESGMAMSTLEPLAAALNSSILLLLFPAVFLILMSDYPCIEKNAYFYISRSGRISWLLGQFIFLIMSIVCYIAVMSGIIILLSAGSGEWQFEWSRITRIYGTVFPERIGNYTMRLLPPNLYNQMSLGRAVLYSSSLLFLNLLLLGLLQMAGSLIFKSRRAGLMAVFAVLILGGVFTVADLKMMWFFPFANSVIWLHFSEIFRKPLVPVTRSYLYFGALILILAVICFYLVKRIDYDDQEVMQ